MPKLHTFGCSITQGFALPDVVKPILDSNGEPLPEHEVQKLMDSGSASWTDVHLYQPSDCAWPKVLADKLGVSVNNYARRGACFHQISRQCAIAKDIKPDDIVIVMWTYLSRLSLQWPARTSVPFNNMTGPASGWKSIISGFNNFFGLEPSKESDKNSDEYIQQYIKDSTKTTYLNPMGIYNRYYNNLILQKMTDGFLKSTGARVIHLSVEAEPSLQQLEGTRQLLDESLKEPYNIPDPADWYDIDVDHTSCLVILDPNIPPAENDEHPSVTHHSNFAEHIYNQYFKGKIDES